MLADDDDEKKYTFDDNKRPALPYVAGACFEIKRHEALPPFDSGVCYNFPEPFILDDPLLPSEILRSSNISEPHDNMTPWSWHPDGTDPGRIPPETITERYLRHRPRKLEPHYHEDRTVHVRRLEVVRQVRVRDGAYAQVVQCRVDGIPGPLVAKIFDPLYRSDDVPLDEPQSPVGLTESEWSREAAAYARLRERGLEGRYTPRFEGCWSFDMPYELALELASNSAADHIAVTTNTTGGCQSGELGGKQPEGESEENAHRTINITRNVRLLLVEYIPGDSILHLLETDTYSKIPPDVRIELLAEIAEAMSAMSHIRMSHGDLSSRNVIVSAKGEDRHLSPSSHPEEGEGGARTGQNRRGRREKGVQEWRVTLIDFGSSVVQDLPNAKSKIRERPALPLPSNPMTRCRGLWPVNDLCLDIECLDPELHYYKRKEVNWIDKRYDSPETRHKWMEARWGKGSQNAHLYQPVEYNKLA